jgi:hypothetical protein
MRDKEKQLRQFLEKKRNKELRTSEKNRMIHDFLKYIETLINIFRLSEKLDAAGDTLTRVFNISKKDLLDNKEKHIQNLKNFLINFDIWGSYLPLTTQSWDTHQARAAGYEKLSIFRASLRDFIKQNEKEKR